MKKLRKILLALTLGASVLITGCSSQDSPANGNGNGGIFGNNENNNNNGNNGNDNNNGNNGNNNNNGNNGNNNNNGNNGNNNNNNVNTGNGGGSAFTVNGSQLNIVNAVYSRDNSTTAIMFEGTLNDNAMLVIAAATGSFDDSATYMQRDFGNTIEVVACLLDTSTAEYVVGSSATSGITNAQITTNANMTISVSGTLVSDIYGNMPFAVSSVVTSTQMENISEKINAYDQFVSSANGNTGGNGGGNTGGNTGTTNRCPDCRGLRNCRSCRGDGTCHICVEGMTRCLSCNGSRVCQHCRGQRICPYCNGTGYV